MLEARDVTYKAGSKTLLQATSPQFPPGCFHVIMGPNGAGKSTLLQLLAGEHKPTAGTVSWNGAPLTSFSALQLAQQRAVLSQHYALQFSITVREVVQLGRYPHAGQLSRAAEEALVHECLGAMDMDDFAARDYTTLSGGEAQKVQMARVLAQLGGSGARGKLLFLDEPVSHLDIRFQHRLLQAAHGLAATGNTVVAVLHDINLALRYADRLLFLKEGVLQYDIAHPRELMPRMVEDVFGIRCRLFPMDDGLPLVVFS